MKTSSSNSIKKPKSLFPTFFKGFSVFIFVALCSFFGCLQLYSPTPISQMISNPTSAEEEEDDALTQLLSALMEFQNIDASFSLSFKGANYTQTSSQALANAVSAQSATNLSEISSIEDVYVCMSGNVIYDETGLELELDFTLNEVSYAVKVVYFDNKIYLTLDEGTFMYDLSTEVSSSQGTTGSAGNVDFSAILNTITSKLGIEFDLVSSLQDFLGIDFDNLDLNSMLEVLDISYEQQEDEGWEFKIKYGSVITILVDTDKNFNIASVKTNNIRISNNTLAFSMNVSGMNDTDIATGEKREIKVSFAESGSEVDLSGLGVYASYVQNLFENDFLQASVDVAYGQQSYNFDVILDTSNLDAQDFAMEDDEELQDYLQKVAKNVLSKAGIQVSTEIEGTHVTISLAGGVVYLDVDGVKVLWNSEDYSLWSSSIDSILQKHFDSSISQIFSEMMQQLSAGAGEVSQSVSQGIDTSSSGLISTIFALLQGAQGSGYIPTNATLTENGYTLSWEEFELVLQNENCQLSGVSLSGSGLEVAVSFDVLDAGFAVDSDEFFDLSNLLPLVDYVNENIDFEGLVECVSSIENLLKNDYILAQVNFAYADVFAQADVILDISKISFDDIISAISAKDEDALLSAVLNLLQNVKMQISTEIEGIDVTISVVYGKIYANIGGAKVAFDVADYGTWQTTIDAILAEHFDTSTTAIVSTYLEKLSQVASAAAENASESVDVSAVTIFAAMFGILSSDEAISYLPTSAAMTENGFVASWAGDDKAFEMQISFAIASGTLSGISFDGFDATASVNLQVLEQGFEIVDSEYLDLTNLLPIANYANSCEVKLDFELTYNNLDIDGTFVFEDGDFEVTATILGETLSIRSYCGGIFVTYNNMKFQMQTSSANTSSKTLEDVWADIVEVVDNLLSDAYGVDIQFGVFEELLQIVSSYSLTDYIQNSLISGDENGVSLTFYKSGKFLTSEIFSAEVGYKNGEVYSLSANLYNILTLSATVNNNISLSTVNASEYSSYGTNAVASLLDSFAVEGEIGVYALSTDLAVRYSTNTFYGTLTAMLVEENGTYTPSILVETSALGLSTYIYLINEALYIDLSGLQIKATLDDLDTVIDFVETYFLSSDEDEEESGDSNSASQTSNELEAAEAAAEFVMVVLPAIDKIYGQWVSLTVGASTYSGIEINITDKLQYSASAWFEDIVMQLYVDSTGDVVLPYQLIVGANITDPNTTVSTSGYSEYALRDNGGEGSVVETELTTSLNFAIYLSNFKTSVDVSTIFVRATDADEKLLETYANFSSVASNYGTSALSDFNDLQTVIETVETIYNYAISGNYKMNVTADVASTQDVSATVSASEAANRTNISGAVVASTSTLAEGEKNESGISLFNDTELDVQGNLLVNIYEDSALSALHAIDLLYESNGGGLYVTYSHDSYADDTTSSGETVDNYGNNNYTDGNELKVNIPNAKMSSLMSMIVALLDVDLGEKLTSGLSLSTCTTDFSFVRSLLGLGSEDVSDDISKVDGILSSVTSAMKLLNNISLTKTTNSKTGLSETTLQILIDTSSINEQSSEQIATVCIVLKEEAQTDGSTKMVLREISLENFVYGQTVIDATIEIEDFVETENNFDYDTTATHMDLSELDSFLDTTVNTINQRTLTYSGTVEVSMLSIVIELDIDLTLTIDETGELYFYTQMDVGVQTSTSVGAWLVKAVAFDDSSWDSRVAIIEYNANGNGKLTLRRFTDNSEDSLTKSSYSLSELLGTDSSGDLYLYTFMKDLLGLNSTAVSLLKSVIASVEAHPTMEKAILGFTTTTDTNSSGLISKYTLEVDGSNLMGISGVTGIDTDNMVVELGVSYLDGYVAGSDGATKVFGFIESIKTDLSLGGSVDISVSLGSSDGSTYYTTSDSMPNNSQYRENAANVSTIVFDSNGGSDVETIYVQTGTTLDSLTSPTKENYVDEDKTIVYTFDHWAFEDGTPFVYGQSCVSQGTTTLYAVYNEKVFSYNHYFTFVTGSDEEVSSEKIANDGVVNLTSLQTWSETITNSDGMLQDVEHVFVGWYTEDGEQWTADRVLTVDDATSITLYAMWQDTYSDPYVTVTLMDGDVEVDSLTLYSTSSNIVFENYSDADENTLIYTTSDFSGDSVYYSQLQNLTFENFTQEGSLVLYVRNMYTLTYTTLSVDGSTVVESEQQTMKVYQGTALSSVLSHLSQVYGEVIGYSTSLKRFETSTTDSGVYTDSSGNLYRLKYTVSGYTVDGTLYTDFVMTNRDLVLRVSYASTSEYYYRVELNLNKYRPSDISTTDYLITEWGDAATNPVIYALEDETIDLSGYKLERSVTIDRTFFSDEYYTYVSTSWGTSEWSNGTAANSGDTEYTVSSSNASGYTINLYACWERKSS